MGIYSTKPCIKCGVPFDGWGIICNACKISQKLDNIDYHAASVGSAIPHDEFNNRFGYAVGIVLCIFFLLLAWLFPELGISKFVIFTLHVLYIWLGMILGLFWGIVTMLF